MSETHQVDTPDPDSPTFCPASRKNIIPRSGALLDLNQGKEAQDESDHGTRVFEDMNCFPLFSSFTEKWVATGNVAKLSSESATSHLPFERQCKHCEKNLTMYPWIAEKVKQERLSIHGGYYDFLSCTFEKWTLDVRRACGLEGSSYFIKDRQFWS